MRTW
jgi:hypothetical protein